MSLYLSSKDDMEDAVLAGYSGTGWYFWDETETHIIGPYKDLEKLEAGRKKYMEYLSTEKEPV